MEEERNSLDSGYTYDEFELMGCEPKHWADQLCTDLENMYKNNGNKVIGFYSDPAELSKFKMIMYNVEIFERYKSFDLEVENIITDGADLGMWNLFIKTVL